MPQFVPRSSSSFRKALWLTGAHDDARAKFAAARAMDLSPGDRAMLDRVARATARA